jgi:uncharacterized phage protein gp47/JayE
MAILTAQNFSAQMVAQLRILDPSISAEIGTPERKIIDTVAQSLADNQVDLTGLSSALDLGSKYGSNLDQFTGLFGFARQGSTYATGYVVFSRNTPAPATITIPTGVTVQSNTLTADGQFLQYSTTTGGSIPQGEVQSGAVLVQCTTAGSNGNAAAATLTNLVGVGVGATITYGVTGVTNPAPLTTGSDSESDNSYKTRFQNTVFRNLAGTEDQYLALALSTTFSSKSNVIGPVSTYQEYIQIPDVDDAGYLNAIPYANNSIVNGSTIPVTATPGGVTNQWTTSLSAIPYAQDIYLNPPPIVTNGSVDGTYFYRQGTDYIFNYPPVIYGDASRENETSGLSPNFTFINVFNPPNAALALEGLQTASPQQVMLSEFSYLSAASRNSIQHNVYNAIDVYVDGSNPTDASCVFLPGLASFTANPNDALYTENFRRDGEPTQRPHVGNFFSPLFQSPLISLPNTISVTVGSQAYNYYLGYHYWLVHEISVLGGSIRARDGIEWNATLNADDSQLGVPGEQPPNLFAPPLAPYSPGSDQPSGSTTVSFISSGQSQVEVDDYFYDANVTTLQATMENARPSTIDVLAHSAQMRYFKPDVTIVYTPNANQAVTNSAISGSLTNYFNNQLFGSVCLLSDILNLVQNTPGVANVRWSNDLPSVPNLIRIYETDINGYPLHTPWVDRFIAGQPGNVNQPGVHESQRLYIPAFGSFGPTDSFQLQWNDPTQTVPVAWTSGVIHLTGLTPATLQTAIRSGVGYPGAGSAYHNIIVTQDAFGGSATSPMQSFLFSYPAASAMFLPSVVNLNVTTSYYDYDQDFYLRDNELAASPNGQTPTDTVAGAIIRPRAQGTFIRPGIG